MQHEQSRHVWQQCILRHEPTHLCFSLVKSEPTGRTVSSSNSMERRLSSILIEQPYGAYKWKYLHIFYVWWKCLLHFVLYPIVRFKKAFSLTFRGFWFSTSSAILCLRLGSALSNSYSRACLIIVVIWGHWLVILPCTISETAKAGYEIAVCLTVGSVWWST